jgi:hypothetical protein
MMVPDIKDYADNNGIIDFNGNIDNQLYDLFHISEIGRAHIKRVLAAKFNATDTTALFDTDSQIDPNFGFFSLEECGVSVGDVIVYTPTGTELIVAEDNMVECDGLLMSIAEFTAKYMPRNKRSISGVCQGPRYFSYNGVSLYKMKESFLGGSNK